ncbi:MAG: hypothetical protein ACPGSL_09625 [Vicingaceae bacterium]
MRTLKLKIAVTALALIPFVGFAQETSIQKSKEHQKNMIKELNLNEKQSIQLKDINLKNRGKVKAINAKMEPLKAQMKELKMMKKALHEANMKEIEAVLTPEQFIKFKEMKARKKANRQEKKRNK